ncbi:MAG: hypothetical protein AMDU3_IPLC00004G0578 [Thermoplasmatales archaeon I-plasma]|jgi:hypothetical protein|nr:MAG: hypothetical protein AMDU3_IPLC00004G0578 [Thermoplasmatales archaeon I-plasma]
MDKKEVYMEKVVRRRVDYLLFIDFTLTITYSTLRYALVEILNKVLLKDYL